MSASRILRLASGLALVSFSTLALCDSQITYKCKGANGEWAAENCTGAAAPKPSSLALSREAETEAKESVTKRKDSWFKMCRENYECANQHAADYGHMHLILLDNAEESIAGAKARDCFLRWYVASAEAVDATMWRYCYYSP